MFHRRIDSRSESEQGEDVVLGGREGGEMAQGDLGRAHDGKGDLLEGGQQEFGGGVPGGAGGIARIEAGQRALLLGQAHAGGIVERGEDAQGDGQEADQAGDMVVTLQVEGREREGAAFEAAEAALDQILLAIGQDGLGQREGGDGGIGGIDAPALTPARSPGLICRHRRRPVSYSFRPPRLRN